MWGLAAAFGPVGWVVAAVGTAATAYALMDDDDDYTYSNKSEKEAEAREESRTKKKDKIKQEIEAYKQKQIKRLKDKYDVDVEFVLHKKENVINASWGLNNAVQENKINIIGKKPNNTVNIKLLEKSNKELMYLIENFEKLKHNETE